MRIAVPPEIKELAEMQTPYVFYDKTEGLIKLRKDAPQEVVEARKKYLAWWESQKTA